MHRCKASYRQSNSKVSSPVLMLKCNATDIRSHAAPAPSCSRLDSGKNNALDHTPTSWTQGHIANHLTKITTNAHTRRLPHVVWCHFATTRSGLDTVQSWQQAL